MDPGITFFAATMLLSGMIGMAHVLHSVYLAQVGAWLYCLGFPLYLCVYRNKKGGHTSE